MFVLLFVFCCVRFLQTRQDLYLVAVAIVLCLINNLRSLYHPVWAGLCLTLLLFLGAWQRRQSGDRRRSKAGLIAAVILGAGLSLWPLKNALLFDQFTFSTWSGYNLTIRTHLPENAIDHFRRSGHITEKTRTALQEYAVRYGEENIRTIAAICKSNGTRNLNHIVLAITNRDLIRAGHNWRKKHRQQWLKISLSHYPMWCRPAFVQPYSGVIRGPNNKAYHRYAKAYSTILFYDLRPFFNRTCRFVLDVFDRPPEFVPYTLFGFVVFPAVMVLSLVSLLRHIRRKEIDRMGTGFILLTIGWVLLVPCMTAGAEGNRMRFAVMPIWGVLLAVQIRTLESWIVRLYRVIKQP